MPNAGLSLAVFALGFTLGCGSDSTADSTPGPGCAGACAAPLTQAALDAWAASLELSLEIIENEPADCASDAPFPLCHDARLALTNRGAAFDAPGWSIYWTNQHRVLRVDAGELALKHVNGTLHAIEPTAAFRAFAAGESKPIAFRAEGCWIAESDGMPRAYVAAPGLTPAPIANTDTEDVGAWLAPLTTPAQTECATLVRPELASAESRFEANLATQDLGAAAAALEVIPRPLASVPGGASIDLASGVSLQAPGLGPATLEAVAERLSQLGIAASPNGRAVFVSIDPADAAFAGRASAEAYRLTAAFDAITIVGGDAAGAFHGIQTWLGLIASEPGASPLMPALEVPYDAPRFSYRGLQLDVARNFHGLPVLERVLSQMAAYKLNALHLHLSDDEGFRLEVPGLPELTDVGARRCHDLEERTCLLPQFGSGPRADTSGSGHFTRTEFVSLLRRATALHIEVIPELDLPGHARAAIRAMAVRAANGDASFSLADADDTSEYFSVQGYRDNVVNACLESTYAFVARLMDEVIAMYREAEAPLETWHIGADEVPAGAWTASPACEALFAAGGAVQSAADVSAYFLRRVSALAAERGLGLRLWGDGAAETVFGAEGPVSTPRLDPAADAPGVPLSVNWYSALRFFDNAPGPLTDAGYQVVLTSADHLYLDHAAEADPKERGFYWSTRFLDARKIFSFMPGNLAANAQLSRDCEGGACDYFFGTLAPITRRENIIGIETAQWSETVRTAEQLEAMLFPRLLAFAERAWHRAAWEPADAAGAGALIDRDALQADWQRFANAVGYRGLPALERAGVRYRVEVPGARLTGGVLAANLPLPGSTLEYRNAAGEFVRYDPSAPPALDATEVRALTARGRAGRAIAVRSEPTATKRTAAQPAASKRAAAQPAPARP